MSTPHHSITFNLWAVGAAGMLPLPTRTVLRRDLPIREPKPGVHVALFNPLGDHALNEGKKFKHRLKTLPSLHGLELTMTPPSLNTLQHYIDAGKRKPSAAHSPPACHTLCRTSSSCRTARHRCVSSHFLVVSRKPPRPWEEKKGAGKARGLVIILIAKTFFRGGLLKSEIPPSTHCRRSFT